MMFWLEHWGERRNTRWFVIERDGVLVASAKGGDYFGFGEVPLVHHAPRTETVNSSDGFASVHPP
jgi:hypothetical protein